MKKVSIHNLILYLIIIILLGVIIISNKNIILDNSKITLKNMNETTQISDLNNSIETLNRSHTNYFNYIQTSKINLAEAITNAGITTSANDSFETMINNVSNLVTSNLTKTCVVLNTLMYTQLPQDTKVVKNTIDISQLYSDYKDITADNIHIEPLTIYCTTGSAFSNYSYVSYEYDNTTGIISVVLTGQGTSGNSVKNRSWYVYSTAGKEIPVNIIIVK